MAGINMLMGYSEALRPCFVKGRKALFHRWSHHSKIRDALLQGQASGVIAADFGIVEYEDGTVEEVYPCSIQFCDRMLDQYCFEVEE